MKKALSLALAALLAACSFTACGGEGAADGTTAASDTTSDYVEETTQPASETTVNMEETTQPAAETTTPVEEITISTTEPTHVVTEPGSGGHTHVFTATVIPATCTAPGTTAYFCECGENYTEGETPPQGHFFGEWVTVKSPTQTEPGLEQRACAVCGEIEENYIEP